MDKGIIAFYIVLYAVVLIAFAAAIAFAIKLSNGGTDELKLFYVTDEAGKVYASSDSAALLGSKETKFGVKYALTENKGYTVKLLANVTDETIFNYTVDGDTYEWSENLDLMPAFKIATYDDYFTLIMPDSMLSVLRAIYKGKALTVSSEISTVEKAYFKLVVTSYSGNQQTTILLRSKSAVTNIGTEDNLSGIVFY